MAENMTARELLADNTARKIAATDLERDNDGFMFVPMDTSPNGFDVFQSMNYLFNRPDGDEHWSQKRRSLSFSSRQI